MKKLLARILDRIPGVDRIWDALSPPDLGPGEKVAAWCMAAAVIVTILWVLT